jgi:hypothetical protein
MKTISGWLPIVLAVLAVFTSPSCIVEHACGAVGCGSTARVLTDAPGTFEEIRQATLTVCRNDDCRSAPLAELKEPLVSTGFGVPLLAQGPSDAAPPVDASVIVFRNGDGSFWMDVNWNVRSPEQPKAGDRYRVKLTSAAGTALIDLSDTVVKYEEHQPNGSDCAPVCHTVMFDHRKAGADR